MNVGTGELANHLDLNIESVYLLSMPEKDYSPMFDYKGLPDRLIAPYDRLVLAVTDIHLIADMFFTLFYSKPERHDLLRKTSGIFFVSLYGILADTFITHAFRLMEHEYTGSKRNLNLESLITLLKEDSNDSLAKECSCILTELRKQGQKLKKIRHKKISHLDQDAAFKPEKYLLPESFNSDMKTFLDGISNLMNLISSHYCGSSAYFTPCSYQGTDSLLDFLEMGLERYNEKFNLNV